MTFQVLGFLVAIGIFQQYRCVRGVFAWGSPLLQVLVLTRQLQALGAVEGARFPDREV